MGIFDSSKTKQIEYLEEERKKLWERLDSLEKYADGLKNDIERKTSDDEREARQNSRKSSEFRNKIEVKLIEANQIIEQLSKEFESARKAQNEINEFSESANLQKLSVDESKNRLEDAESEFENKLEKINSRIGNIDSILEKYPDFESQLLEIDNYTINVEENLEKSGISLNALNKRKRDIDDLHREVFGYTQVDEESGVETKIEGLKDELNYSFKELEEKFEESSKNVEIINTNYEEKYDLFEKEIVYP